MCNNSIININNTMTETMKDLATELADSLGTQRSSSLPSASQIYRTGRILYHYHHRDQSSPSSAKTNLIDGFDRILCTISRSHLSTVLLRGINYAFAELIFLYASSLSHAPTQIISSIGALLPLRVHANKLASSYTWDDVLQGTESLCGIYLSETACGALVSEEEEDGANALLQIAFISLSWVYDCISSKDKTEDRDIKDVILHTLSMLLRHGLINSSKKRSQDGDNDDELTNIMDTIQNIQAALGEYNYALGDMLEKEGSEPDSFVSILRSLFTSIDSSHQQPPQLQYLLAMLRSSPQSTNNVEPEAVPPPPTEIESKQPLQKQHNMVDIQIEHIHSILPSLGEGYIEEALKCYDHDVEMTLEALLQFSEESGSGNASNNNIHPRLRTLPKNLPRQLKKSVDHYTANVDLHRGATAKEDGKEHVKRQKELIRNEVKKAEEEALLVENVSRALGGLKVSAVDDESDDDVYFQSNRNEYDDDYDDQYDGIGNDGGIGIDEGLYDVDSDNIKQKYDRGGAKNEQEMWRKYNSLVRDLESENSFWEENRNLNRVGGRDKGKTNADNIDSNGGKRFGPDKGNKGRIIGPDGKYLPIKRGGKKANGGRGGGGNANGNAGRGGKQGRGAGKKGNNANSQAGANKKQGENGDDMSKIQKRRKNDNKAKIGNHHRKDRATKKASGGMV